MKFALALRLLPLLLGCGIAAGGAETPPARRPNLVVIFTDDQPQRALGAADPYFHTPHLDQLAREGVFFENSFVTTAVCAVSRASLLTDQHLALNIDLAPSLLTLAGEPVPPAMQGMDLGPILRDARAPGRSEWYYEHDVHTASGGKPLPRCEGVRTARWKYIRYKDTSPVQEELFDLAADAGEQTNLAPDPRHATLLSEMRQRYAALRAAAK